MSVDYSFHIAIGYAIAPDEIFSIFGKVIDPVTVTKERWCPDTGKKLGPVTAVTKERKVVLKSRFFGPWVEYNDLDQFSEALENYLGCTVWINQSVDTQDDLIIGPSSLSFLKDDTDFGRVQIGGSIHFTEVADCKEELDRIHEALSALGLRPKFPIVTIVYNIG